LAAEWVNQPADDRWFREPAPEPAKEPAFNAKAQSREAAK